MRPIRPNAWPAGRHHGRTRNPLPGLLARHAFIARPFCERLGTPFAVDIGGPLLSPAAIADPPAFARARAVARHDGAARELSTS